MVSPYDIKVTPTAFRHFQSLPSKQRKLIVRLVEALAINPRPPGSKKINGMTGLYSETINQLKLIYKIEEQEIFVLLIKHFVADSHSKE